MAFSAGGGPSQPEINVTPLIDVLLTIIIIFMVAVTQQKPTGLEAQISQPAKDDHAPSTIPRTIVIQLKEQSGQRPTLKINQEDVTWTDLKDRLQRIFIERVEKVTFVKGDATLDFQYVADVIDIAHAAGVERVGLLGGQGR